MPTEIEAEPGRTVVKIDKYGMLSYMLIQPDRTLVYHLAAELPAATRSLVEETLRLRQKRIITVGDLDFAPWAADFSVIAEPSMEVFSLNAVPTKDLFTITHDGEGGNGWYVMNRGSGAVVYCGVGMPAFRSARTRAISMTNDARLFYLRLSQLEAA